MVSSKLRNLWIPILALVGLFLVFLKLPEVQSQFGLFQCKLCFSNSSPYIPLIGAAYFSLILSAALLFSGFPGIHLARGGVIWAVSLAFGLTYIHLPNVCVICLLGHICNVAIWTLWVMVPHDENGVPVKHHKERICLMLFGTFTVVALFCCMNLTVLIYSLKNSQTFMASGLATGNAIPSFVATTSRGKEISKSVITGSNDTFINFVSPNCPYCKEQLAILNKYGNSSKKIIAISPLLEPDLENLLPGADWVEDVDGDLRQRFKVEGYPTLFVIGSEGIIEKVIPGVSDALNDLQ